MSHEVLPCFGSRDAAQALAVDQSLEQSVNTITDFSVSPLTPMCSVLSKLLIHLGNTGVLTPNSRAFVDLLTDRKQRGQAIDESSRHGDQAPEEP